MLKEALWQLWFFSQLGETFFTKWSENLHSENAWEIDPKHCLLKYSCTEMSIRFCTFFIIPIAYLVLAVIQYWVLLNQLGLDPIDSSLCMICHLNCALGWPVCKMEKRVTITNDHLCNWEVWNDWIFLNLLDSDLFCKVSKSATLVIFLLSLIQWH